MSEHSQAPEPASPPLEWDLVFVLPDLVWREADTGFAGQTWLATATLGSDYLAIVPPSDARVAAIRARYPEAEKLLSGFTDSYGHRIDPSALICRREFPDLVGGRWEPVIAFRNAVAMSAVLRGRAGLALRLGQAGPMWTDVFDLHPTTINRLGQLYTDSPATTDIRMPAQPFFGTQSPFVAANRVHLLVDQPIYRELGRRWCRRYLPPASDDDSSRSLFRSLEVAYRAASLGRVSLASIHDVGVQVALWVSAIEILAWLTQRRVNLGSVLALLGQFDWRVGGLDNAVYSVMQDRKGNVVKGNLVQRGYSLLYGARNRFLHGEPVSAATLQSAEAPNASPILVAAIVYRTALAVYLGLVPETADGRGLTAIESTLSLATHATYAQALATQFDLASEDWCDYLPHP